ncbi:hypothetical protein RHECNPAF_35000122 [Rhizobium etli CNPAF512]|nr:hypothetical protein RHECNPAF_35000122 [Rhizobium etli CNPAF512]
MCPSIGFFTSLLSSAVRTRPARCGEDRSRRGRPEGHRSDVSRYFLV